MWQGKMKAVTFSFDDGVVQDVRLIEMLNKYGLKATFNINSGKFGIKDTIVRNGRSVCHDRISECDICRAYEGHEVAAHTLTHPNFTTVSDEVIAYEVEEDRKRLSALVGYEVDAEYISWERFEEICRMLSGHSDIFYGTNREVLLGE